MLPPFAKLKAKCKIMKGDKSERIKECFEQLVDEVIATDIIPRLFSLKTKCKRIMKGDESERIRECYEMLVDEVRAKDIVPGLFSLRVLTKRDRAEIMAKETNHQQMELLIDKLYGKPDNVYPYKSFLKVLMEDYKHLVEALQNVTTTADPKLKTEVNQMEYADELRKILLKNYTTKSDKKIEVALHEIQTLLSKKANNIPGGFNWKKEMLTDFVCKTFRIKHVTRSGKRKAIYFKNLIKKSEVVKPPLCQERQNMAAKEEVLGAVGGCLEEGKEIVKDASEECLEQKEEITTGALEGYSNSCLAEKNEKNIAAMNVMELEDYLTEMFKQKNIVTNIPAIFAKEGVSGEVLMTMDEKEIKEMTNENFGTIRCLTIFKESMKPKDEGLKQKNYEKLRKFSNYADHTIKYKQGCWVDALEGPRRQKLNPLRYFCRYDVTDDDLMADMSREIVKFVSACLNTRQNGTIYFGIEHSADDSNAARIVGIQVNREMFMDIFEDYLKNCFEETVKDVISRITSKPEFVEVIDKEHTCLNTCVIEVDVNPTQTILSSVTELVKTKAKRMKEVSKNRKIKDLYYRLSQNGSPEFIQLQDIMAFQNELAGHIQNRSQEERLELPAPRSRNLRKKMLDNLTGGRDTLDDIIYPLLILSPVDYNNFNAEHFQFIKHLWPKAVFDFDPLSSSQGIYHDLDFSEVLQVLTLNNFDNTSSKDSKKLANSVQTGDKIPWVFCNGHQAQEIKELPLVDWNRQKRSNFQECLKMFCSKVSKKRTIVIFFLLSKNYETMLAGCEEILTHYSDQWVLFAESENLLQQWKESMLHHGKVTKRDIENHCIVGMPLDQINTQIMELFTYSNNNACELPRSNGTYTKVRADKIIEWSSVEVLSASDPVTDESPEKDKRKLEEEYYKGYPVQWLNFYYGDQVLRRSFHNSLKAKVEEALQSSEDEEMVTSVVVLHQPGAGGTTSAKHVMWELRKEYRCCIVKNITDELCDQLMEVREYDDMSHKPLLILVDNEDEEKCKKLQCDLEMKSRQYYKQSDRDDTSTLYATLLICARRSSLPNQIKPRWINVPHILKDEEIEWFREKYKLFIDNGIDPKYLFSFNVLRTNSNPDYIKTVVKEFVDDIESEAEIELLTAIAFLNRYAFKPIPVSCFDHLYMNKSPVSSQQRPLNWEAELSQPTLVLLNVSHPKRNRTDSSRETFKVVSVRIAEGLLDYLKSKSKRKESEIMKQLIHSLAFDACTKDGDTFREIIGNIMKEREINSDGNREFFSRFITNIMRNEGEQIAVKLLKGLFERNNDAFTAQQVARFYIVMKEWKEAEHFAKTAKNLQCDNAYLWDTYGQVFKKQLYDIIAFEKKAVDSGEAFGKDKICKIIKLAKEAIQCFKEEQSVGDKHTLREPNLSGYFGELKCQIMLLDVLARCSYFRNRSELRTYLLDPKFHLHSINFLQSDEVDFLKQLERNSKETMRRLDEQYLQVKNVVNNNNMTSSFDFKMNRNVLFSLMVSFSDYFCEDLSEDKLSQEEYLQYKYRKAVKEGAGSLHQLLQKRFEKDYSSLLDVFQLMLPVVQKSMDFDHLLAMLNVVSVLIVDGRVPSGLIYPSILEWCNHFYRSSLPQSTKRQYLEQFLYFYMYNFPTNERQQYDICSINDLVDVQKKWFHAFKVNYPEKDEQLRKERTLFFLGKGALGTDLVHQDSLNALDSKQNRAEKWHQSEMREKLRTLKGALEYGGEKITMHIERGESKHSLTIPTAYKVKNRSLWQTKVYFFVGFSFSGPKAYAISKDPPSDAETKAPQLFSFKLHGYNEPQSLKVTHQPPKSKSISVPFLTVKKEELIKELSKIKSKISFKNKKNTNPKELKDLEQKMKEAAQEIKEIERKIRQLLD